MELISRRNSSKHLEWLILENKYWGCGGSNYFFFLIVNIAVLSNKDQVESTKLLELIIESS